MGGHDAPRREPLAGGAQPCRPRSVSRATVVLLAEGLGLAVTNNHSRRSRCGPPTEESGEGGLTEPLSHPLGFLSCQWEPRSSGAVPATCSSSGGPRTSSASAPSWRSSSSAQAVATPASRWSRRRPRSGPEIIEVYAALFHQARCGRGVRRTPRGPRPGLRTGTCRRARPGHRHLHDRRQPAQALHGDRRHAVRRRDRRGPRSRRHRSAAPRPGPASSPRTWSRSVRAAPPPSSG